MSKIIKTPLLFLLFLTGGYVGYLVFGVHYPRFKDLSASEMYKRVIKERDFAIGKAVEAGDYRCCINPPCTMCYMEANQWNNQKEGTCACDDLITQGGKPCPQCVRGLCEENEQGACQINGGLQ